MTTNKTTTPPLHKPFYHNGHARPKTRRELLSQGFIAGTTTYFAPNLLGFFGGRSGQALAQAKDCGFSSNTAGDSLPVLMIDLAGGASSCGGNICVGRDGDQTDTRQFSERAWVKLGHTSDFRYNANGDQVDRSLGLPFVSSSRVLAGIKSNLNEDNQAKVNGVVYCSRSANDTGNNLLNPAFALTRAGASGTILPIIGTVPRPVGGKSLGPYIEPTRSPLVVSTYSHARALQDTRQLLSVMEDDVESVDVLLRLIGKFSQHRIARMNEDELARELLACKYEIVRDKAVGGGGSDALDPQLDPLIEEAFGNTTVPDVFIKTRVASKLLIDGYVGGATIEFPGYDYHDGTRVTGDNLDFIVGRCIGSALQYAALKQQPLMIYVFSDGSVFGDDVVDATGQYVWRGDDSTTAGTYILHYNPAGRVPFATHQVGNFNASDGSSDRSVLTAGNQTALAEAIALNYMALNGNVADFEIAFPDAALDKNNLAQYAGVAL